ncbi:MAG: MtrB/PioB family decaheme-associated outer membrane protein [Magnetospirillum sp.]|nr:MtrB/PioB family decaheme-associated outer membrane protein [Magnetospirillum sp.]
MIKKLAIALSTTCLIPFAALADDDFGISEEPVPKAVPTYFNYMELGGAYSSDNPLAARRFSGQSDDGLLPVGSLSYLYRTPYDQNGADFLRVEGSNFGFNSRRLAVEGGEQGAYKLSFGYELLPFSAFRGLTPFNGEGTNHLSLVPGYQAGTTPTTMTAANLNRLRPIDLRTERERFGSGMTWQIDPQYSMRMAARHEKKEGLRPMGVNGSSAMMVPAPVNYQDDQVETELGFADKKMQWRLGYNMSLFRNEDNFLRIDNPFATGTNTREQMALAPDNSAHSFFADGGYQFTDTTRLTTNLSYSQYLQDDTFLPFSVNQTDSRQLPRQSLDGRISTTTANVELSTRPMAKLDMKTRYRFTNRRNDTPVSEFYYISSDGTGASDTSTARYRRNTPFSYQENLASLDFGYAVTPRTKVTTGYEFREFERSHSERAKNTDHTGYVGMRSNLAEGLTGNAKYSHMMRDGSTYSPQGSLVYTNNPAYVSSSLYDNHPGLRKYFEADLVRDRLQTGLNYSPADAWNLGISGGVTIDDYLRSELGLTDAVATNATLDASYQASPDLTLTGFYTYERRTTEQAGWQSTNINDPNRRWWVSIAEDAHTTGLGSKWQVREGWKLLLDYAFVWTVTEIDNKRTDATVSGLANASSFPDITSKSHSVSARAEYDLTDNVVLGLGYALEIYRSKDWALDNLNVNSTSVLSMGEQSPNYNAHLFLVTTRAKF